MTKEEIQKTSALDLSEKSWLREIALQLALLNEKHIQAVPEVKKPPKPAR